MPRRKPCKPGDWFAVLLTTGYGLGRIARVGRRGRILLGYFFGPLQVSVPTVEDTVGLTARDAFYITKFTDNGLELGEWPIVDRPPAWDRENWPLPRFGRLFELVPGRGFSVQYD